MSDVRDFDPWLDAHRGTVEAVEVRAAEGEARLDAFEQGLAAASTAAWAAPSGPREPDAALVALDALRAEQAASREALDAALANPEDAPATEALTRVVVDGQVVRVPVDPERQRAAIAEHRQRRAETAAAVDRIHAEHAAKGARRCPI